MKQNKTTLSRLSLGQLQVNLQQENNNVEYYVDNVESYGHHVSHDIMSVRDRISDAESELDGVDELWERTFSPAVDASERTDDEIADMDADGTCSDLPYVDHSELDNMDSKLADVESELESALECIRESRSDLLNFKSYCASMCHYVRERASTERELDKRQAS